jgi:hypothetical protein
MSRGAFLLLLCTGCSTAPIADMLDYFKPGQLEPAKATPYGGVCLPRPIGPPVPGTADVPAGAPATGPAIPGPAMPPILGTPVPQGPSLPPPDFGGALTPIPVTPPPGAVPQAGALPPVSTVPQR